MSAFGKEHEDANEIYKLINDMIKERGLAHTLYYLGKILSLISGNSTF